MNQRMSRFSALILAALAFAIGGGIGVLGFLWATGGTGEPSRDIEDVAPTLSLDPELDVLLATEVAQISTRLDDLSAQVDAIASQQAAAQEQTTNSGQESNSASEGQALNDERVLFRIDSDESMARFVVEEFLAGSTNMVEGTTRQVGGDIIVNFNNPSQSEVGDIVINARTLRTDNSFRDQALRSQILESASDEFEFITFSPTRLENLPESGVAVGDTLEFQIVGDLIMKSASREVTFDAAVTIAAEDRLEGAASVTINYADWGITIRTPPTVSDVADEVILEIDFVATQVDED